MKNLSVFFFFLITVTFLGCNTDNPTENPSAMTSKGQVLLKIDRVNAPSNIFEITAELSRDGFSSVTSTLNFISDTTADLTLDAIQAGIWHLNIEAKDSSGLILYAGESDVNVVANFITQVNLTLLPTGNGTGSIYIFVNWGNVSNWVDFGSNPIIVPTSYTPQINGIAQQYVLFDEGKYKMWYMGIGNSASTVIYYAESTNGITWTHPTPTPVLTPGNTYAWDSRSVQPGAIIKDEGVYKMYYFGFADPYDEWKIGLAQSTDGIFWTKHPTPILTSPVTNAYQIVSSSILKVNNLYYLYYVLRNYPKNDICLATSSDGINWTHYSGNPVLTSTQSWEGFGVAEPSVINDNGTFKMVYMNTLGTAFGLATSSDGKEWTKSSNQPFFTTQNTSNNWANGSIAYPCFIKVGNEYRIYYSGYPVNNSVYKIGFTKKL